MYAEVIACLQIYSDYELLQAKINWKKDHDRQFKKMHGILNRHPIAMVLNWCFIFPRVYISIGARTFTPEDICRCNLHAQNKTAVKFAVFPLEYYKDVSMCDEQDYCAPCFVIGGRGYGKLC